MRSKVDWHEERPIDVFESHPHPGLGFQND